MKRRQYTHAAFFTYSYILNMYMYPMHWDHSLQLAVVFFSLYTPNSFVACLLVVVSGFLQAHFHLRRVSFGVVSLFSPLHYWHRSFGVGVAIASSLHPCSFVSGVLKASPTVEPQPIVYCSLSRLSPVSTRDIVARASLRLLLFFFFFSSSDLKGLLHPLCLPALT